MTQDGRTGRRTDGSRVRLVLTLLLFVIPSFRPSIVQSQDPTGHWRTLETAHFNIHVREDYRELGPRAAAEAERAWTALSAVMPPPTRRIELVIADNVDESNGFASTYPLPKMVIYAMPPSGDLQLSEYDSWMRLVVTHELAHLFHLDQAHGLWAIGRSLLGRAPVLFPDNYSPPWMREGLAVFYESRLTTRGRLGGPFHEAVIAAARDELGGFPLDVANTPSPVWPAGIKAYAFGSAVMGDVASRVGDSAVARFAGRLATLPLPYLQAGTAWRQATGEGIAESWRAAQPGIENPPPVTHHPSPLFSSLRYVIAPRVSSDGRRVAFAHYDGRDVFRLMVLDRDSAPRADGSLPWRRIARINQASAIAWMPDGNVLASQLEFTDPYTTRSDLWVYDMRGGSRQLTRGRRLTEADVAPDGAIVAVEIVPGGNRVVMLPAGGGSQDWNVILPAAPGIEYATPRFDSAGTTIALVRVERGWHDIVLADRSGRIVRQLTRDAATDIHPVFTPDGARVVWSRAIDGRFALVTADVVEGAVSRAVLEPYAAWYPAPFSADSLLYIAYHADGFRLMAGALGDAPLARDMTSGDPPPDSVPPATIYQEHAYRAFPSLLPQYWMPQLFMEAGGARIGGLTSGEDVLGRHFWAASVLAGLGSSGGQVAADLGYTYSGLRNLVLDASYSRQPQLFLLPRDTTAGAPADIVCCTRDEAMHAGVSFGRRRSRSSLNVRIGLEATNEPLLARRGGSINATFTRLASSALAISPQDGFRVNASIRHRRRVSGDLSNTQLLVRATGFASSRSTSFARQVFAVRGAFGIETGSDRVLFGAGGVSSGALEVLPGIALGGSTRNFQVRGYAPGTLAGRKALGLSLENRVPLALLGRSIGMLPLGVDRVSASLFTDAAMAWNVAYCPGFETGTPIKASCSNWIWTVGAELATDIGMAYEIPLRVRAGGALRVRDNGLGMWVALGSSF